MYKISHSYFVDIKIFFSTLWYKKWLDKNGYSYNLIDGQFFKAYLYKSFENDLRFRIKSSESFKKISKRNGIYKIYLTRFGTFGSYEMPNVIYLNVRRNSADEIFETMIHELIHLQVEGEVIKKNLSHKEKEEMVEALEKLYKKIS